MWTRAMMSSGGGGNVKSGTFTVSNVSAAAGSITPFDTGLGSSIKHIVIIAEHPDATSGKFSMIGWDELFPTHYKYVSYGAGGTGGTVAIGTSQNVTLMFDKRPDTNNGVIEMSWTTLNPGSKTGTYYWYAE